MTTQLSAQDATTGDAPVRSMQIDADSHIEEGPEVFRHLDSEFSHRRPFIIDIGDAVRHRPARDKVWLIDGEIRPKLFGPNPSCYATPNTSTWANNKPIAPAVQSMMDTSGFLAAMDSVPVDKIVVYSTLFLHPLTEDPRYEAALMGAWNSYIHEQAGATGGRVGFGALIPTRDPHLGAKEVHRAKALGASAIMLLPVAGRKMLDDRSFDPIWAAAVETGLPVSIHVGWSHNGIQESCGSIAAAMVMDFEMSTPFGMFSFLAGGILDRFPTLRVAFLEAGSVWLPAILDRIDKWRNTPTAEVWPAERTPEEYLATGNIFFTVEGDENNLVEFIRSVGHRQILGSADFPHVHYAGGKLGEGYSMLRAHPDLTDEEKTAILGENAQQFYNWAG